ncbi:MAG: hypothetical protein H7338_17115 [Candidatus Sericytochromatia bacterium]|nr:hypothetical protein [Candidatus Sericytochromatia bacterium]
MSQFVASVRDLLGKDREHLGWAQAALAVVNTFCKAVLWHGDAGFLPFDFPFAAQLTPPVLASGYVRQGLPPRWQPQPGHWVAPAPPPLALAGAATSVKLLQTLWT